MKELEACIAQLENYYRATGYRGAFFFAQSLRVHRDLIAAGKIEDSYAKMAGLW